MSKRMGARGIFLRGGSNLRAVAPTFLLHVDNNLTVVEKLATVASHPVVIVLGTKLDALCKSQSTDDRRLLTTLGDDRRAIAELFLVQRLGESSG